MRMNMNIFYCKYIKIKLLFIYNKRECSSNGRALALHARGNGIDAHLFQTSIITETNPNFRMQVRFIAIT